MKVALLLTLLAISSLAQFLPEYEPQQGDPIVLNYVDVKKMEGSWYGVFTFNDRIQNGGNTSHPNITCWRGEYTFDSKLSSMNVSWVYNISGVISTYNTSFIVDNRGTVWGHEDPDYVLGWIAVDVVNYNWALGATFEYQDAVYISRVQNISAAYAASSNAILYGEGYNVSPTSYYTINNNGCPASKKEIDI